jgi:hypothetical protein
MVDILPTRQNVLNAPTAPLNQPARKNGVAINDSYVSNNVRFPMPPQTGVAGFTFPSDLVTNNRNYYTQIQFVKYQRPSVFVAPFLMPLGGVSLPLPKKINDTVTVIWEAVDGGAVAAGIEAYNATGSTVDALATAGAAAALRAGSNIGAFLPNTRSFAGNIGLGALGAASQSGTPQILGALGYAINPFLTMLFKTSNFKEHSLQWTFTPNSQDESDNLAAIINYFKFNMLPSYAGLFLEYPNIALIQLYPDDQFTFKFKPCAITAVSVDYSGGGNPSFFRNGAPTIVNLSVQLKEIELWTQNDYTLGI